MGKPHDPLQPLSEVERNELQREAQRRSVARVARELGVPRSSLAGVLSGTARAGTLALVALGMERRRVGRVA